MKKFPVIAAVLAATLLFAGCSKSSNSVTTTTSSAPATTTAPTPSTTSTLPMQSGGVVNEYASSAIATTNYGSAPGSDWNASQATGAPDVTTCGDNGKAWASLAKNTIDTLTLTYPQALIPSQIRYFESFNPGFVTIIKVSGGGQTATVYTATPAVNAACPSAHNVAIANVTFPVDTVAITVDQTTLGDWAEIDAVQLTGTVPPKA